MKDFAPNVPRTDDGWVNFPQQDSDLRKRLFVEESMQHPAKINLHMLQAIVEYVSEVDERIMDIMSGTGSMMIAALQGRSVTCVEISEQFFGWMEASLKKMEDIAPGISSAVTLINAPCQRVLPLPCDHIIFSPPYANIMSKKAGKVDKMAREVYGEILSEYTDSNSDKGRHNLGLLNQFFYSQEMEKVYKLCYDSIKPGGTLSVVTKDYIKDGKRVLISEWIVKCCLKMGFEQYAWFKRPAQGGAFQQARRFRGDLTVDEEDAIILRRPSLLHLFVKSYVKSEYNVDTSTGELIPAYA